jgi:Na+-transporting methylmalonyl-CoA/oxaloacetate decarboxylase gamma subunit
MWISADGLWVFAGGVGAVLAALVILGLAVLGFNALVDRLFERFTRAVAAAAPAPEPPAQMRTEAEKRGKEHRNMVEVSERYTSPLLEAARDLEVAQARIENALLLSEWLRAGGSTTAGWGQIVKWKQAQLGKGAPTDKA